MADMVQVRRNGAAQFRELPDVKIGRSQFNRSHGLKTTFDASYLVPILVDEVLPGDTFTLKMNGFARVFSPLEAPIMDNIELETFFFFVPNRLIWDNWENFNGRASAGGIQTADLEIPVVDAATVTEGSLADHMGLPIGLDFSQVDVNSLPFRAYRFIYNEWFKDENLIANVSVPVSSDGPDDDTHALTLLKSAKKHDYFTSCLPYLQKGDPQTLPLSGEAEIWQSGSAGSNPTIYSEGEADYHRLDADSTFLDISATSGLVGQVLFAKLDTVTGSGISINALRESVAIQRLLERDARGGTRYTEMIKAHFGVTNPDFRLQRPEYLGGGKSYINVSAVANTSSTATEDQGELRGIGMGSISGHGFASSFTEHGYIIGLVRARGDITYHQGLERMWSRQTRYDFYIPALANLGEQSVLNKELYVSNTPATDNATFGYQERWAEYRYKPSQLHNEFRPDHSTSLDFWHLAEDFSSTPSLNQTFIEDQTPMSRVTVTDSQSDFILDAWFDYKCARPLPVYSIPSLTTMRF